MPSAVRAAMVKKLRVRRSDWVWPTPHISSNCTPESFRLNRYRGTSIYPVRPPNVVAGAVRRDGTHAVGAELAADVLMGGVALLLGEVIVVIVSFSFVSGSGSGQPGRPAAVDGNDHARSRNDARSEARNAATGACSSGCPGDASAAGVIVPR